MNAQRKINQGEKSLIDLEVGEFKRQIYLKIYKRYLGGETVIDIANEQNTTVMNIYKHFKEYGFELEEGRVRDKTLLTKKAKKMKNKEQKYEIFQIGKRLFPNNKQFGGEGVRKW